MVPNANQASSKPQQFGKQTRSVVMSKSKAKSNGSMKAKVMDAVGAAGDKAQTVYADVKQAASSAADAVVKKAKVVRKQAEAAVKTVRKEASAAAKTVRKAVDDKVVKPATKAVANARKRIAGAKKKPAAKKAAAKKKVAAKKKPAAKKAARKAPAKKAAKKAAKKK
jgi:hypothetical protein